MFLKFSLTCQVCVCAGGCPAAGCQGCGDRGGAGEGEEEEQDGDGDTQVDNITKYFYPPHKIFSGPGPGSR